MKTLLSLLFVLLSCLAVKGQDAELFTIEGQVVEEESGKPIPWATVALTKFPFTEIMVKGTVTDENGYFKLVAPKEEYQLIIRSLGFRNEGMTLDEGMDGKVNMGVVRMKMQPENLAMVTVKPLVEVSPDEITYNLMADPDRETSTLHAILDKVPLIKRTPMGDLYVDDPTKRFLVVRNGKVDALFEGNINDVLKAIPAKGFATVTVMLAPPERYGNVDYVVNITVDKNARLYGAVGLLRADGDVSNGVIAPDGTLMTSLNKVRANIGGGFKNTNAPKSTNTMSYEYTNGETMTQRQQSNRSEEDWVAGTMLSADLAKEHFANWRFSYRETTGREKSRTETSTNGQAPAYTDFLRREKTGHWSGDIEYQYDIGDTKQVLNVAYRFSLSPKDYNDYGASDSADTWTDEKQQEQTLQVHYYNPLSKKLRLETGISYIYRDYFQEVYESGVLVNKFDDSKHVINAYARLNYSQKRFSFFANLKMDYLNDGDGALLMTNGQEERISNTGIHFIPEARIALSFPGKLFSHISLDYQLSHLRPSLRSLSIYENHSNPNFIQKGNPELKDIREHRLRLQTRMNRWAVYLVWSYSGNNIGTYWYEDEQQRIIQTRANQGYDSRYSLSINPPNISRKNWSFYIGSSASYTHARMAQEEKEESWWVIVSLRGSYTFPKQWVIGLSAGYHDSFSKGYSSFKMNPYSLAFDLRKQFLNDRGELSVRYGDLLHFKSKTTQEVNAADFTMNQEIKQTQIALSVNLRFRIGSYKVKPVREIRKGVVIDDLMTE